VTTAAITRTEPRTTTPITYFLDDDRFIVIAANQGAPAYPDWYHNLVAHPQVTVEVGTETFKTTAVVEVDSEWQRLWDRVVELYPFFAEYRTKTSRQRPVIGLSRQES